MTTFIREYEVCLHHLAGLEKDLSFWEAQPETENKATRVKALNETISILEQRITRLEEKMDEEKEHEFLIRDHF